MKTQRWRRVDELFQAAVEMEPTKRAVFLDEACSGDHALRSEVEAMLASDSDGWDYVERPALQMAAALLLDQPQLPPGEIIAHTGLSVRSAEAEWEKSIWPRTKGLVAR